MDISVDEEVVRISVVTPSGSIDAFRAPQLRDKIDGLLNSGVRHIVFDLSGASFLDSAGLAVLVSSMKRARQAGGDVRLVWPSAEAAQRVLVLTKFDKVFERFGTREAATSSFLR